MTQGLMGEDEKYIDIQGITVYNIDIMRALELITIAFIIILFLAKVTDYPRREAELNRYNCAVYGKEPDCKTPLPESRRLK